MSNFRIIIWLIAAWTLFIILMLSTQKAKCQEVLTLDPGSNVAGQAVVLNLTLNSQPGSEPTALQWTIPAPTGVTSMSVVAGSSSTNAAKSVSCDAASSKCIVFGINQNLILNGVVATITMMIDPAAQSGVFAIVVNNPAASTASGANIPITAVGSNLTVIGPTQTPTPTPSLIPTPTPKPTPGPTPTPISQSILMPATWVKPPCTRANSGQWAQTRYAGLKDAVQICAGDAQGNFAWRFVW